LTTFSSGWPSSSFLIGSSCFLPDHVRAFLGALEELSESQG
jgi:hypothetical protein